MIFTSRRLEPVAQRVRARIGKRVILGTTRAQLLFEDERHPWRAVPKDALLVWSYLQPLAEAASLAGLVGIPDDDPAVQLLIDDSPARHTNAG